MDNPWDPEVVPGPTNATGPQNDQSAAAEWTAALARPEARGALLQFGLNMMGTPEFGQTGMGMFAQSVGGAGEYLTRQDEEARKEREMVRKEADTQSLGNYRMDQAEIGHVKADAATKNAESLASVRQAQLAVHASRASELDAKVELLKARTASEPQNADAKAALAEARAEQARAHAALDMARAGVVPQQAATAARRADVTEKKLTADEVRAGARNQTQLTGTYERAKAEHNKRQEFSREKVPFPSFTEWAKTNGADKALTPRGAPSVDPAAEAAKAKAAIDRGADPDAIRRLYRERTGQDLP